MKMNNIKNISKYIFSSALVAFSTLNCSFAYQALYFDSSISLVNRSFHVNIREDVGESETRLEDKVAAGTRSEVYGNKSHKWRTILLPNTVTNYYEAGDRKLFAQFAREESNNADKTTKLVTFPGLKFVGTDGDKTVLDVGKQSHKGRILMDIVAGYDRGEDENGNRKISMEEGLNELLNIIGKLRGGYADDDEFLNTVKGLGYLMEIGNNSIKFKGSGRKAEAEETETSEDGTVDKSEIPSDGGDIEVSMAGTGEIVKVFTIKQPSSGFEAKVTMPIAAHTGLEVTSVVTSKKAAGAIQAKYKDDEDTDGKYVYLVSEGESSNVLASKEEIRLLKLSNLIKHALIKVEGGIQGEGKMNKFEKIIYGIFDAILSVFESILGLFDLEELVYNKSDSSGIKTARSDYHYGMYPKQWSKLIRTVYSFVGIISISILVFGVLRIFGRLTFDSMNTGKRFAVKEDIMMIVKALVIMLLFQIVINALAMINYVFVKTVYSGLGASGIGFLDVENSGPDLLANIVLRAIMVYINCYMNIIYIIRSITIALLIALSPAFVVSLCFGKDKLFSTFVGEIIGNIFMQSFHALVLLFIFQAQALVLTDFTRSIFVVIILSLSVVPLTKAFKDMVIPSTLADVGHSVGQKYASKPFDIAEKVGTTAMGAAIAIKGHKMGEALSKGDQVRDKINGIGKEYSTDMFGAIKDVEAAGGVKNYMEGFGIKFDKDGNLPSDLDTTLMNSNMSDEDKNKVRALADFTKNVSNDDLEALNKAQKIENRMDFKALASAKNLTRATSIAKRKADRKNGESNASSIKESLMESVGVNNMEELSKAVENLSNGNNLYQDGGSYTASNKLFESFGMKNFESFTVPDGGEEFGGMRFELGQDALSGGALPSASETRELPTEPRGSVEVARTISGGYEQLAMQKEEYLGLVRNNADEASKQKALEIYNYTNTQLQNRIRTKGGQLGMRKVEVKGGAFDLKSNDPVQVSCITARPGNTMGSIGNDPKSGYRYNPGK